MKYRVVLFSLFVIASALSASALSASAQTATADPVQLHTAVDRETAQVVDPIKLTITVTGPAGTKVTFPERAEQLGPFDVQQFQTTMDVPVAGGGQRRWIAHWTLDSLQSGPLTIPAIAVQYRVAGPGQAEGTLHSQPIPIRITSLLEDRAAPTDFRDIKQTIDIPVATPTSYAWLWWSLGATGGVIVLTAAIWWLLGRRSGVSPAQWALQQIVSLESTDDRQISREAVFAELADVIRQFIDYQYGIAAPSQSSQELLGNVASNQTLPAAATDRLRQFLSVADDVKYARRTMDADQLAESIDQAKQFITACQHGGDSIAKEAA
ncbi:BatD family protein [Stieleria sp. TO1_6]|uniref:DUF4381 family protein n=1 Tax=Stieleria tagensis TaxID=2956795 RepID=UPI00209B2A24|nr:DUF4381 family protein [Stieleria tagensis]MCO8122177.1 BatD family protein [Stieleria tagensis]